MKDLLCLLVYIISFFLLSSCGKNADSKKINTSIGLLSAETGLVFPSDAKIIYESNGGGRDASFKFYEWVVFSKSRIEMPAREGEDRKYFRDSIDTSVAILEKRVGTITASNPTDSCSSSWRLSGYRFDSTLIEVNSGYYLMISRIK